ncbi:MAG: hypothetical protein ABJB34_07385, partial [Acidobacteriota bacterium]
MKNASRIRRPAVSRGSIAKLLTLVLMTALASPAFAVVFTNTTAITIDDATAIGIGNPYPSPISISGLAGTVTNVTVTLNNLTGTFPSDMDVLLVAPTGANLILMSDVGGGDDITNTTLTFDDASAASLLTTKLFSGAYKPTNIGTGDTFPAPAPAPSANTTLAGAFNGIDANGTWNLYVVDDAGVDMQVFGNGWSLTVTTSGSPATIFSNGTAIHGGDGGRGRATPYASTIVSTGLTGAITDVKVTLNNLNHLNPDDLDIMLVGPSGKRIILLSDAGGTTDVVAADVTFDDAAAAGVPDAGPLVTATVKPTNFGTGDTLPDLTGPYPNSATAGTATLASVFNGTVPNGTWSLYIVDDATTSAGTVTGGWSIDITAGGTFGAKRFTSSDFAGDGRTDIGTFRPSDGNWWVKDSSSYGTSVANWGLSGDVPVPGDYDGDRKTDFAIFRPSTAVWYVLNSTTNTAIIAGWGTSTDIPVPADYNSDGSVDIAIWRGSTGAYEGTYWIRGQNLILKWGVNGDIPLRGDFDGNGNADFTVFRPSNGQWLIHDRIVGSVRIVPWGPSTDRLVPADYDGDGKTDVAIFRPSEGNWYIVPSANPLSPSIFHFGQNGDTPVPGDYDGDSA